MKDYSKLQNGSDIRGVALEGIEGEHVNLTALAAEDLSRGFASWLSDRTGKPVSDLTVAVGTDSRISAKALLENCCNALSSFGVNVLSCGMASTPAMFMATQFKESGCDGAIMITASHLPFNRNGFKYFTKEAGLEKGDIKALIAKAEAFDIPENCKGDAAKIKDFDLMALYCDHIKGLIKNALGGDSPLSGLHIVVDAGNGAGGFYADKILKPLGADISGSQFLDPDGSFPNHQPNPENKAAMDSISAAVLKNNADLGIIFDTDVDRSAAVDEKGREIARNGIVAMAAALVSEEFPGSTVVTDSITSTQLKAFLEEDLKMKHLRFKRGYRNVINKGMETENCHLAIETSGHAAIKENYWLDDGAYLATKIVIKTARLKKEGKAISEVIADLKEPLEAKEIRIKVLSDDFAAYGESVLSEFRLLPGWSFEEPNYEGIRVNTPEGWFLLRKSLHDPLLPLNIESDIKGGVEKMQGEIKKQLEGFDKLDLSIF